MVYLSYRLYGVQRYLCEEVNDHRLLKRQVVLFDHEFPTIFLMHCSYFCVVACVAILYDML